MKKNRTRHALRIAAFLFAFCSAWMVNSAAAATAPTIGGLEGGRLRWQAPTDASSNVIGRIETTSDLTSPGWAPVRFELVSTNLTFPRWTPIAFTPPTNGVRMTTVSTNAQGYAFYRVAMQTNPDPSLVMHLSFDNDFTNGLVLDLSGNGNHGFRYEQTRWPAPTPGPDGSQAARFHIYTDGFGTYKRSGDYITVRNAPSIDNLTNATICVWMYYDKYSTNDMPKQWDSTVLDAGGEAAFCWSLGRLNSGATYFNIAWKPDANPATAIKALTFPDLTTDGSTGGWHFYAVTFDGAYLRNYFDGKFVSSFTTNGLNRLVLGGTYLGIGCWNFSATPILYDGDFRPNNGWIEGSVDDIRIYNRTMSETEIKALYGSYDKLNAPSVPTNVWARVASANQLELRWGASKDDFFVTGYRVIRDGTQIGFATGPSYVDQTVVPSQSYTYAVEAIDAGGHGSGLSATVTTNTTASAPIEVVVDDADGPGRIEIAGTWVGATNATSFGGTCIWGTESRGTKSITFHPTLPGPGDYSVYVWYGGTPSQDVSYFYSLNTPIDIVHNGTTNLVQINQQNGYKSWKLLGTFTFTGDTNELVRIRTDGTALAGHPTWGGVVADAVKFTK